MIDELNLRYGKANRVVFENWPGCSPIVKLKAPCGEASISLYGGQLISCNVSGEIFWFSSSAFMEEGKAMRGGVPVLFPWFGAHPNLKSLPSHGFARTSNFKVLESEIAERTTTLRMVLRDSESTRKYWNHGFEVILEFILGDSAVEEGGAFPESISINFTVKNTGSEEFSFSGGLHSYFNVSDAGSVYVEGVGKRYYDNLDGLIKSTEENLVKFREEVDRVYLDVGDKCQIVDSSRRRRHVLISHGHDSIVIWNPGDSASKPDLSDASKFVCAETTLGAWAKSLSDLKSLSPDESYCMGFKVHLWGE